MALATTSNVRFRTWWMRAGSNEGLRGSGFTPSLVRIMSAHNEPFLKVTTFNTSQRISIKKLTPAEHSHQETSLQNWGPGGHYSLHTWCSPTRNAGGLHRYLFGPRRHWVTLIGTRACRGWGRGASTGRLELGAMSMGQRRLVQVFPRRLSHLTQDWRVCRWNWRIWWLSVTKSKTRGQFLYS